MGSGKSTKSTRRTQDVRPLDAAVRHASDAAGTAVPADARGAAAAVCVGAELPTRAAAPDGAANGPAEALRRGAAAAGRQAAAAAAAGILGAASAHGAAD